MISVITASHLSESMLEDLHRLDQNFFPNPWSVDQWMSLKSSQSEMLYLIKGVDKQIRGFALFGINQLESMGHLYKILILPQYRGQKCAKDLMNFALKDLTERALERVYLEVATNNIIAVKFYKDFEFEVLTLKRKFYSTGDDAFAMQRTL